MGMPLHEPTLRAISRALSVLALGLVFAACGDDPADDAAGKPGATSRTNVAKAPDPTKGMVRGVTDEKKPGAPLDVRFEVKERPTVDKPVPIELAFIPSKPSELLRATFLAADGMTVDAGSAPPEYRNVEAEGVYRHTIRVTPKKEGVFYLTAIVVMTMPTGVESRTFNIPLVVGAPGEGGEATPDRPAEATGSPAATTSASQS
jgi:hypothetical protein